MSNNLELWEKVAEVPTSAQKPIMAGRLKGMTDINPMWRIKKLTEIYGQCGIGWKAPITEQWLEAGANNEVVANVKIELFVKNGEEWSEGITGIGGSMFVADERNGLHTSDEAYKMAYTDAISVACKMLGFGADVYWQAGRSKYTSTPTEPTQTPKSNLATAKEKLRNAMNAKVKQGMSTDEVVEALNKFNSQKRFTEYNEEEIEKALKFLEVLK